MENPQRIPFSLVSVTDPLGYCFRKKERNNPHIHASTMESKTW